MKSKKVKYTPIKPRLPWQTGPFAEDQKIELYIPQPCLLLFKICGITPKRFLTDILDNLSHGSWKREGRDEAKALLVDYFLSLGYGNSRHSPQELRGMFRELDAVGLLFPKGQDSEILDLYAQWRDQFYTNWFDKWVSIPIILI